MKNLKQSVFTLMEILACRSTCVPKPMRRSQPWRRPCRAAFTLIEMLVVIAIIGLLSGLLVPAVSKSLEKARSVKTRSNLRQVHLYHMVFAADHKAEILPSNNSVKYRGPNGAGLVWNQILKSLDYVEDDRAMVFVMAEFLRYYKNVPLTYYNNMGRNPWIGGEVTSGGARSLDELESPSNTVLLTEGRQKADKFSMVTRGMVAVPLPADYLGGKCYIAFADGHVEIMWQSDVPPGPWDGPEGELFWKGRVQ